MDVEAVREAECLARLEVGFDTRLVNLRLQPSGGVMTIGSQLWCLSHPTGVNLCSQAGL
jgi:hypothetical protein